MWATPSLQQPQQFLQQPQQLLQQPQYPLQPPPAAAVLPPHYWPSPPTQHHEPTPNLPQETLGWAQRIKLGEQGAWNPADPLGADVEQESLEAELEQDVLAGDAAEDADLGWSTDAHEFASPGKGGGGGRVQRHGKGGGRKKLGGRVRRVRAGNPPGAAAAGAR